MKLLLYSLLITIINCSEIVNLNVGGKIFTTFRTTLEKAGPDTYFNKLFNSEMSKKTLDSNGNIFLDHDPETFGLLLNLLRGYDVLKGKTQDQMTMLYQDANFFGLTDLMERIEQLPDEYVNTEDYRGGMKRKGKHGYGFEKTADGYYEGDFVEGKKHVKGMQLYKEGIHQGEYKDGQREGHGQFEWNSGSKFVGEFKKDKFIKGKYDWASGNSYEGDFMNSKLHGKGKYTWKNGNFYYGDWLEDKKHGHGIYYSKDHTYEGQFKNDLRHGRGKAVYKDGRVEEGNWEDGQFKGN